MQNNSYLSAKPPGLVAIFLPSMEGGGAERVMLTLANGIAERGFRVDLVLACAQGTYLQSVSPQVRIVDLKSNRVSKSLSGLVRYLKQAKPEVLLTAMTHTNVVASFAHFLARVPTRLFLSEHTTISIEAARANNLLSRCLYKLVPWVYRRSDGIVGVSQGVARDLESFAKLPTQSVRAIYNPSDLDHINQLKTQTISHPWFTQDSNRAVILGIGRLVAQKDFPTLIQAFSLMRERHNARLLILGEGELRDELAQLAISYNLDDDCFQMPGFVGNPFSYLAQAAVFALSSGWEGLGCVVVEALACGTPIVSTDCPSGPREILEDGRWGQLVPVGNVDAFAEALDTALSMPKDDHPDGYQRAADFDQANAIEAYLDVLGLPRHANTVPAS